MATYSSNTTIAATPTKYSGTYGSLVTLYTVPAGRWAEVIIQACTGGTFDIMRSGGAVTLLNTSSASLITKYIIGPGDYVRGANATGVAGDVVIIEYRSTP